MKPRCPALWAVGVLATAAVACGPGHPLPVARAPMPPMQLEHDLRPLPTPTPVPAVPGGTRTGGVSGAGVVRSPAYPVVFRISAPSVGIDLPVVAVGVVRGAMEAPEGPLGSSFWREAFWLQYGAVPGTPGTATIAGHLDDTAGRPAAFWNLRSLRVGDLVTVTRLADGVRVTYRITEVEVLPDAVAATPPWLHRIYGSAAGGADDGVARITLVTCTGRWRGAGAGYDHRFLAFGEMVTG